MNAIMHQLSELIKILNKKMTVTESFITEQCAPEQKAPQTETIEEIKSHVQGEIAEEQNKEITNPTENVLDKQVEETTVEPAEETSPGQRRRSSRLSLSADKRRPIVDADTGDEEELGEEEIAPKTPKTPKTPGSGTGKRGRPKKIKTEEAVSVQPEPKPSKHGESTEKEVDVPASEKELEVPASEPVTAPQAAVEQSAETVTNDGFVVMEKPADMPEKTEAEIETEAVVSEPATTA